MAHSEPSMTRRDLLGSLAVLAMPGTIAATLGASAQGPKREVVIVEKATEALVEINKIPARGIPLDLLRKAQGIVIVPDLVKVGFVIAGRVGRGVLMARDENGSWTNPVFLGMAGGSIGAQIGASDTDIILVFRTRKSVDDFLSHNKVTLGADIAVAAGPLGRQAEADTDLKMRAEILSYSRSRGLFAGVAIEGASLHVRHRANDAYYNEPNLLVGDILAGRDADDRPLAIPPSAVHLRKTLDALCVAPKPVPRGAASRVEPRRR
jgi:lipid-binding SYLF domain-containing protein